MFRNITQRYKFNIETIGKMTLLQAIIYMRKGEDEESPAPAGKPIHTYSELLKFAEEVREKVGV